jgi:hydroxymethylbilane synthase
MQGRLSQLADAAATSAVLAERAFALRLGGNCQTPLGAYATLRGGGNALTELHIDGMVGSTDGKTVLRDAETGPVANAAELGRRLAERLLAMGAAALLRD